MGTPVYLWTLRGGLGQSDHTVLLSPGMSCTMWGLTSDILHFFLRRLWDEMVLVFAFEPSPTVFERLHSNIELNRNRIRSKVELMQEALYDETGQKAFLWGAARQQGRLVRFPQSVSDSMMTLVPVTTIDDLVARGLPFPDVIKIDAEYVEDRVIQGAVRTLKDHDTIILCEVHSEDLGGTS